MNDHPSPLERMDVERRSLSPKRKKIRQKYAPKACVSCRRSKLKCSGENPCQRCIDNGKRCFFSEDQTAAEALQNLSRPTPAQPPPVTLASNGIPRRNILSRNEGTDRRESDVSMVGIPIEARMARIEMMMEALMRDRGMTMPPMGSIDRDDNHSDGFRSENAFSMPLLDPINPALAHMGPQPTYSHESPNWTQPSVHYVPTTSICPTRNIQLRNRIMPLPFPAPASYQHYMQSFFTDIHLRYPSLDEADFRIRSDSMLAGDYVQTHDTYLLALNYIIFACCDILLDQAAPSNDTKPRGWQWCELVNGLVDKDALLIGGMDLTLIQLLLFQALYFAFADIPELAYNTIGIGSRLVLQHNLHQQPSWTDISPDQAYMRSSVFWNVFICDRLISFSCGRPHTIKEADIYVDTPIESFARISAVTSDQPDGLVTDITIMDFKYYASLYLNYMSLWARFIGNTGPADDRLDDDYRNDLDSQISHFLNNDLPSMIIPFTRQGNLVVESPLKAFLAQKKFDYLLWGFRQEISSLQYDASKATTFGSLVHQTINKMRTFSRRSSSFRHQMVSTLGGALLTTCSLLIREALTPNAEAQQASEYLKDNFREIVSILQDLAEGFAYARRVLYDFRALIDVVNGIISHSAPLPTHVFDLFPYRTPEVARATSPSTYRSAGAIDVQLSGHGGERSDVGSAVLWLL